MRYSYRIKHREHRGHNLSWGAGVGGREAGLDNRNCWNYHLLNQWLMLGYRDKVKDLGGQIGQV